MFQAALFCCDGKRDVKGFLKPIIKEFELFSKQPFRILVDDREKALAHMHLLCITSDLVESSKLVDFGGQHPDEDGKNGMYYTLQNQPLRTVASLMLDEVDFFNQDNYGIRAPSIFGSLSSFTSPFFVALDEFQLASNVAELFRLFYQDSFTCWHVDEKSLKVSKGHVSGFLGRWILYNLRSKKKPSAYRSVCWLDVLRYTFSTLVAPFLPADAAKALVALVRELSFMLQKNLDESLIKEMEE
ncbi:hypothetical protein A0J61_11579 [Choanephora cucurbitarum]|uniref:Uncharacterized protein n=1 Tax=Choanephora cucurbitarum TaxID=101091 RepID=A0A1C7MU73_9FUNG|nr:hypothetical protein A0J61_11579 [Choanephora cucurbitarum]